MNIDNGQWKNDASVINHITLVATAAVAAARLKNNNKKGKAKTLNGSDSEIDAERNASFDSGAKSMLFLCVFCLRCTTFVPRRHSMSVSALVVFCEHLQSC